MDSALQVGYCASDGQTDLRKPCRTARTFWREYTSSLDWAQLWIPQSELNNRLTDRCCRNVTATVDLVDFVHIKILIKGFMDKNIQQRVKKTADFNTSCRASTTASNCHRQEELILNSKTNFWRVQVIVPQFSMCWSAVTLRSGWKPTAWPHKPLWIYSTVNPCDGSVTRLEV